MNHLDAPFLSHCNFSHVKLAKSFHGPSCPKFRWQNHDLRRVLDGHRHDEVLWELVELRNPIVGQDYGEDVEVGSFPGPAEFLAELREYFIYI